MAEVDDGGPATARDLLRFIPTVLVRQLAHQGTKVGFREGKVPIHAAFVFLDISGLHQLPAGFRIVQCSWDDWGLRELNRQFNKEDAPRIVAKVATSAGSLGLGSGAL